MAKPKRKEEPAKNHPAEGQIRKADSWRRISAIKKHEDKLIESNKNLESAVQKKTAELSKAKNELAVENDKKNKKEAELVLANKKLAVQTSEKADKAAELITANRELILQKKSKRKPNL